MRTDTTNTGSIYLSVWTALIDEASIDEKNNVSYNFRLMQNYPNPFNTGTIINYQISKTSRVMLKIYNSIGEKIGTLVDETKSPGSYIAEFNGQNLSSGVYFYVLESGNYREVKKMVLIK